MKSKSSLSMKTRALLGILAGAAIWCACQKEARHVVKEDIPVPKDSVWISVSASKGEPEAKPEKKPAVKKTVKKVKGSAK
jgi:hypothetical protein